MYPKALAALACCALLGLAAASANAAVPERFSGSDSDSDLHFVQCHGFEVQRVSSGSFDGTTYFDESGEVVRVLVRDRATDTFTNSVTGETVTNRGTFEQVFTRIGDSEDFTHVIVGYRFMANLPGEGVVLQDVGRVVFAPGNEQILAMAGQHHVPDGPEADAAFCAALS